MSLSKLKTALKHMSGKHNQKLHGRKSGKSTVDSELVSYDWEVADEFDGDPYEVASQAGLYISNDKEPVSIAVVDGKIVGALFVASDHYNDEFTADVAVLPEYQGKGIGSKLVDEMMDQYDMNSYDFPEMKFRVDAVNPQMAAMLKKRGFIQTGTTMSGEELYYEPS